MVIQDQVILLYAVTNGFMDDVEVNKVAEFKEQLLRHMSLNNPEIGRAIASEGKISDETSAGIESAIAEFKHTGAVLIQKLKRSKWFQHSPLARS